MVDMVTLMAKEYFGNTVYQYGISFSLLIVFIVVGRILDFLIKKPIDFSELETYINGALDIA